MRDQRISRRGNNASPAGSSVGTRKTKYRSVLALLRAICRPASPIIISIRSDKMSQFKVGAEAGNFTDEDKGQVQNNKFTSLPQGKSIYVKVIDKNAKMSYFGYGIYRPSVNTFAAKNPSKKSAKGYPVENLTPFDRAWKYHADKSKEFQDEHSQEAYKYMPKLRGSFGFYDLTTGEQIVVDFTKKQAEAVQSTIDKYEKRLDRMAFELHKTSSSRPTDVVVTLEPIPFPDEDLTEEQLNNFENAPKEFDYSLFEGLVYEMDDEEQIETLQRVGFDVSKIGLSVGDGESKDEDSANPFEGVADADESEEGDLTGRKSVG